MRWYRPLNKNLFYNQKVGRLIDIDFVGFACGRESVLLQRLTLSHAEVPLR